MANKPNIKLVIASLFTPALAANMSSNATPAAARAFDIGQAAGVVAIIGLVAAGASYLLLKRK